VVAEARYLEAQEAVVNAAGHAEGLRVLNSKLPQSRALTHADLCPDGPVQLYRTTAERHFVLIGGGDSWFKNVLDCRQEVHESAFKSARLTGVG
jgi:hypothetical protein